MQKKKYKLFLRSQCTATLSTILYLDINMSFVLRLSRIRHTHTKSLGNLSFSCYNFFKWQDSQRFEIGAWNSACHRCMRCLQCMQSVLCNKVTHISCCLSKQVGSCLFFVFKSWMIIADIQRPGDSDWSGQTRPASTFILHIYSMPGLIK